MSEEKLKESIDYCMNKLEKGGFKYIDGSHG